MLFMFTFLGSVVCVLHIKVFCSLRDFFLFFSSLMASLFMFNSDPSGIYFGIWSEVKL